MRKAIAFVALFGVLTAVGFLLARGPGGERRAVTAWADDGVAVAYGRAAPQEVRLATSGNPSVDPDRRNIFSTVDGRKAAARVADCFRDQGVQNIDVAEAQPPTSLKTTGQPVN